jgi:hypothetical protein
MQTPDDKVDQRVKMASEEAAYWYLRSIDEKLSLAEKREFVCWLRRSPANISELLQISKFATRNDRVVFRFLRTRPDAQHGRSRKLALSLTYFSHLKRQHLYSKLMLLSVALCTIVVGFIVESTRSLSLAGISLACFALLSIKELLVGYRVSKGFFGSTESEARDLVQFIIDNANEIDFTDGDGKRRPPLVTEPQHSVISGQPAPGGVLSR